MDRKKLLSKLKRQRTIQNEGVLNQLIDATVDGTVTDVPSLNEHVNTNIMKVSRSWSRAMWKHLSSVKPCTDIVVMESVEPAPSSDMVQMTTAMKELMHDRKPFPLVPPKFSTPPIPEFDRNDWYLTNSQELQTLLGEERCFENRLCFIRLSTLTGRTYVTWCRRKDTRTLLADVNSGMVVLNKHVTSLIDNGDLFETSRVLDDMLGQLVMRDVDDILFALEKETDNHHARYPRGFNLPPPHLVHRSLHELGGSWSTLVTYGQWEASEVNLRNLIQTVRALASETRKFQSVLRRTDPGDAEVYAAMLKKCNDKYSETKSKMCDVEKACSACRRMREKIRSAAVDGIADCIMAERSVPQRLVKLRDIPSPDHELDDVSRCVDDLYTNRVGRVESEVSSAMKVLNMTDKVLNPASIKEAWRTALFEHHPDKTRGNVRVHTQSITHARDILLRYC